MGRWACRGMTMHCGTCPCTTTSFCGTLNHTLGQCGAFTSLQNPTPSFLLRRSVRTSPPYIFAFGPLPRPRPHRSFSITQSISASLCAWPLSTSRLKHVNLVTLTLVLVGLGFREAPIPSPCLHLPFSALTISHVLQYFNYRPTLHILFCFE